MKEKRNFSSSWYVHELVSIIKNYMTCSQEFCVQVLNRSYVFGNAIENV